MTRTIESKFHSLTTEVEAPESLPVGELVSWLQVNDYAALERVCPFDECECDIIEWDATGD